VENATEQFLYLGLLQVQMHTRVQCGRWS